MIKKRYISAIFLTSVISLMGTGFSSWVIGAQVENVETTGSILIATDIYTISFTESAVFSISPSGFVVDGSAVTTAMYSINLNISTNVSTTKLNIFPTIIDNTSYVESNNSKYLFNELQFLGYSYVTTAGSSTSGTSVTSLTSDILSSTSEINVTGFDASVNTLALTLNYSFKFDSSFHYSIYDNIPKTGISMIVTASMGVE